MTALIYYESGAYGTFIEWLLTYLTDESLDDSLPFQSTGNAHNFRGNFLPDYGRTPVDKSYIIRKKLKFARTHTDYSVNYLLEIKDLVLINVYFTKESTHWIWDNAVTKINYEDMKPVGKYLASKYMTEMFYAGNLRNKERFRYHLKHGDQTNQIKGFGYNVDNVDDLLTWQLREILSHWDFNQVLTEYYQPREPIISNRIYNLSLESLRDNFKETILDVLSFLNYKPIPNRVEKLDDIGQQWLTGQTELFKDQKIREYIKKTITGEEFVLANLNFWNEAWIQKKLREQGYEIKCNGLDKFPKSTLEMHKLIYNI